MIIDDIRDFLHENADKKYKDFSAGLTPGIEESNVIGVRTPILKKYAKDIVKQYSADEVETFLTDLPHKYFDENQLHAFIISEIKDYDKCMDEVCKFLPYVDNWATCDQMGPKVFKKHKEELLKQVDIWMESGETFTIRFGIKMLMSHFLDDDFDKKYMTKVAKVRSEEYYVNMMIAWYFATSLAKQYEEAITFVENKTLDKWVHNKTIQKAIESNRVSDEHKAYLRTLKIK